MVAKVISQVKSFFVPADKEIHQLQEYDELPLEDKRALTYIFIIGTEEGFIVNPCNREPVIVIEQCAAVTLPMGTRIEPLTRRQMEDELRLQQKPSLREK